MKTRKFKNSSNAASAVTSLLRKQQCEPIDVHIIMDATGVYHKSLPYRLHDAGAKVSLANQHRSGE